MEGTEEAWSDRRPREISPRRSYEKGRRGRAKENEEGGGGKSKVAANWTITIYHATYRIDLESRESVSVYVYMASPELQPSSGIVTTLEKKAKKLAICWEKKTREKGRTGSSVLEIEPLELREQIIWRAFGSRRDTSSVVNTVEMVLPCSFRRKMLRIVTEFLEKIE